MTKEKNTRFFIAIMSILIIAVMIIIGYWINSQVNKMCYSTEDKKVQRYETKLIELNNTNYILKKKVLSYTCDENVRISNIPRMEHFYVSTWDDAPIPHSYGRCLVKYKVG